MKKTDLRVAKTLRQIDEALLENIAVRPFRDVTLGMLCETAMINKTTFYKYYTDKYDCLNRYLDRLLEEFRTHLDADFVLAMPGQIDNAGYQEQFVRLSDFIYRRRREYLTVWHAQIDRRMFEEMTIAMRESVLHAARAAREFDEKQRALLELYARLFSVHAMSMFYWWFEHEDLVTAEDVRQLMTGNMKNGFFATFRRLF